MRDCIVCVRKLTNDDKVVMVDKIVDGEPVADGYAHIWHFQNPEWDEDD